MKIMAVLAVLLISALCMGAVSANPQYRDVGNGESAFVFENIALQGTTSGSLIQYSDGPNPAVLNVIAGKDGKFQLTEDVVNGIYGVYYYEGTPVDENNTNTKYILIWYPELSLQAELTTDPNGATSGDSIDGKTINKNTKVSFLINSPKVAPAMPASAKIVFTTPAGGKTTIFGSNTANSLANIPLTGTQTNTGGMTIGDAAEAGTWTAQAEYLTAPFNDYAKKSNTVSFTVQSTILTITAAKDSVIHGNPFSVTIQGNSKTDYAVYIDSQEINDVVPTLLKEQDGFQEKFAEEEPMVFDTNYKIQKGLIYITDADKIPISGPIGGVFKTDASGERTIQFNTADNTANKTYTIKVSGLDDPSNYDIVMVKVEKGVITIDASDDNSYYFGNEIKLTGTNTDSSKVYLFVTGPNLNYLSLPTVDVKTDNTWEYKWKTSATGLDTGAYTIYASSVPPSSEPKLELANSEYVSIPVTLKQPFLSAIPSGTIVAKGDKIYLCGTAEGNPSALNIFIFGPNYFKPDSVNVKDDGSYEKKIEIPKTMSSTQYFVVVQHPMYNGVFDAKLESNDPKPFSMDTNYEWHFKTDIDTTGGDGQAFTVWGNNKLQSSTAADALTKIIDSSNIDDIYTKLTFTVTEPMIGVNTPGDQEVGSSVTISGTTNLAVDDQILVEVMSSSFTATDKTSTDVTSGVSQTTKVVAGEGTDNTWSVIVDTTNWKLDEYTIKVDGIGVGGAAATNFNLVKKSSDTPTPTATSTTSTTTATETPATPGFGALVALTGLGSVALLVLRRN